MAGMLSDVIGRRPVMGIADVLFIGGAVGQAVSHTVWAMVRILCVMVTVPSTVCDAITYRLARVFLSGGASALRRASRRSTSKSYPQLACAAAWS